MNMNHINYGQFPCFIKIYTKCFIELYFSYSFKILKNT